MMRKGVSDTVLSMIVVIIIVGFIGFFYFVMISKYFEIDTIVMEFGVERQTLNLGQVLMSYDGLIYIEDEPGYARLHRGVFVKENIDEQLKAGSELTKELGYPNSAIAIYIKDMETNGEWNLAYDGPVNVGGRALADAKCMVSKIDLDWGKLFSVGIINPVAGAVASTWDPLDMISCIISSDASSYGSAVRAFPIAIMDGSAVHAGVMKVTMYQWW